MLGKRRSKSNDGITNLNNYKSYTGGDYDEYSEWVLEQRNIEYEEQRKAKIDYKRIEEEINKINSKKCVYKFAEQCHNSKCSYFHKKCVLPCDNQCIEKKYGNNNTKEIYCRDCRYYYHGGCTHDRCTCTLAMGFTCKFFMKENDFIAQNANVKKKKRKKHKQKNASL